MDNPLSKTRMEFTRDRIQHYSKEARICRDCAHRYYPKVHSQPYIVQFGAVLVGVAIFFLIKYGAPLLYLAFPLVFAVMVIVYYNKDRKAVSPKMQKPKYGEIIIECPKCGKDSP